MTEEIRPKTSAFVFLNTSMGQEQEVLKEVLKLPEIVEGKVTIGQWDIVMKVVVDRYEDLRPLVTERIRSHPKVLETWTMIVAE